MSEKSCSCGHCSGEHKHNNEEQGCKSQCKGCGEGKITLNDMEKSVLLEFLETPYLPVSRFIMASSKEEEARFVSLAPVYMTSKEDQIEDVKEIAAVLLSMESKGLLTLDYDIELNGYDYSIHTQSELYDYFKETVKIASQKPSFLCDTAEIELGSMALTEYGEKLAQVVKQDIGK